MSQLDSQESENIDILLETPIPTTFTPPSINHEILKTGESYEYYSPIPPSLLPSTDELSNNTPGIPCCLGIDEAGRGPVIGPMVYGAFYLPIALERPLLATTHHFDDSKVLTPAFREQLMQKLCTADDTTNTSNQQGSEPNPTSLHANCGWAISSLSALSISTSMLRPITPYNLNAQAMDATITLIRTIYSLGINIKEIYIDTIGHPQTYQTKLERIFPLAKIVVAKKADSLYPCVSAASVVAKVTRDVTLETIWRMEHGASIGIENEHAGEQSEVAQWGSGYPSDARCTTWMKQSVDPIWGWGSEMRFSWGTARDMLETRGVGVPVSWPVEKDDEVMRVTDFFGEAGVEKVDELAGWYGASAGVDCF